MCEQEVEVMEVALGSVFPILLSSGMLFRRVDGVFSLDILLRRYLASRRNATHHAFHQ